MSDMPGHECYHCKQWIEEGEAHDCWTTTEAALTADLSDDLRDAWERLRETAVEFGDQRIYASHNSIMFSRKSSYCFVRPKRSFLELCVFLGREVHAPQIRKAEPTSKTKWVHFIKVMHRDQVEPPITDWLLEAYEFAGMAPAAPAPKKNAASTKKSAPAAKRASVKSVKKSRPATRARRASASTRAARKSPARSGSSRGKR
jgi:Domain of unknown function (DUF5655)